MYCYPKGLCWQPIHRSITWTAAHWTKVSVIFVHTLDPWVQIKNVHKNNEKNSAIRERCYISPYLTSKGLKSDSLGQGNIFTGVCLSIGGLCMVSLPVWLSGPMFLLGGLCLWSHVPSSVQGSLCMGDLCPGGSVQGRSLSRGVSVQEVTIQGVSVWGSLSKGRGSLSGGSFYRDTPQNQESGWYASHWNAFLFHLSSLGIAKRNRVVGKIRLLCKLCWAMHYSWLAVVDRLGNQNVTLLYLGANYMGYWGGTQADA